MAAENRPSAGRPEAAILASMRPRRMAAENRGTAAAPRPCSVSLQ